MSTASVVVSKSFEEILTELESQRAAGGDDAGGGMTIWVEARSPLEMALYFQPMLLDVEVAVELSGCMVTMFDETENLDPGLQRDPDLLASTAVNLSGSVAELTWFFHLMIAFRARGRRR